VDGDQRGYAWNQLARGDGFPVIDGEKSGLRLGHQGLAGWNDSPRAERREIKNRMK
jgi:hypothetical protein